MGIAFVSGSAGNNASGSVTVTAPASIVSGNLLVCIVYSWIATAVTVPTPTGFSLGGTHNSVGDGCMGAFDKVATGSEPGSYTIAGSSGAAFTGVIILQYSGASGFDGSPSFANDPSGQGLYNALTPGVGNAADMFVLGAGNQSSDTYTAPSGFTARNAANSGGGGRTYSFEKLLTSSANTGQPQGLSNFGDSGVLVSMLLLPGGGGGGSTPPQSIPRSPVPTIMRATR